MYIYIYTSKPRTHHAGSHHWGLHRGAQLPLQVFCGSFYMGKFNAETPKRHKLWSNDRALLEGVVQKAGYMSREEQNKCPGQTTKKYVAQGGQTPCWYQRCPSELPATWLGFRHFHLDIIWLFVLKKHNQLRVHPLKCKYVHMTLHSA